MATSAAHLRSLYRRLLRELPARRPSLLANPSPLQLRIRSAFTSSSSSSLAPDRGNPAAMHPQRVDQIIQYLKAQRMYITLVERYNPGMNMDDEERVRLSARRVGMNLPVEVLHGNKGGGGGGGQGGR